MVFNVAYRTIDDVYHASNDVVLCIVCITAKGMEKGNSGSSFLFAGFKN